MRIGSFLAGLLAASSTASPVAALTFSVTTVPGDTLSSDQEAAFTTAEAAWLSVLTDPIAVSLQVGFSPTLGAGVLGSTLSTFVRSSAPSVASHLAADATDGYDAQAVGSLNALPPVGTILLTSAEAKALGYAEAGLDATIQFSSNYGFSTSRQADGSTAAGTYDLIGIAEHEIAHALGFDSHFDLGLSDSTLFDLFRFNSAGTRAMTAADSYFSLDDGVTSLAALSPGPNDTYQASHWLEGTLSDGAIALLNPAVNAGVTETITPIDLQALDVIGYDVAVPEPSSLVVLAAGIAGVLIRRRGVA